MLHSLLHPCHLFRLNNLVLLLLLLLLVVVVLLVLVVVRLDPLIDHSVIQQVLTGLG